MDRMACVNVPELPLQMLLRWCPEWKSSPLVVVDRDRPLGLIQWVNQEARRRGILPGMRYGAALGLCPELRAGLTPQRDIDKAVVLITERLWKLSPRIEPSSSSPGFFCLDASGILSLYSTYKAWITSIQHELSQVGYYCFVTVGFSKLGAYTSARSSSKNGVFKTVEQEQTHVRAVPINRLGLHPRLQGALIKLGIRRLGEFIDLPGPSIRRRFGAEAYDFFQMASGNSWTPFQAKALLPPITKTLVLDFLETKLDRLVTALEPLLQSALRELSRRREAMSSPNSVASIGR